MRLMLDAEVLKAILASNMSERECLAALFTSYVETAKLTEEEAVEEARAKHRAVVEWIASSSEKPRSFLWFCDVFDFDAGSVRRALQEKR